MKNPWTVVTRPILSEKSMGQQKGTNTYVFAVDPSANKHEIKYAVQQIYGVKVEDVRTVVVKGKEKRSRNMVLSGRRKDWKKAYVKLAAGSRLDII
jgi:large subunit ribosomal protein L23